MGLISFFTGRAKHHNEHHYEPRYDPNFHRDAGLLSPEGKLYGCSFAGHDELASFLKFKSAWHAREGSGWIDLCEGYWTLLKDQPKPTQAQLDAIFDWTQRGKNRAMPAWATTTETA